MGYRRPRRVRPPATAVLPRDRPHLCLLCHRLPQFTRQCHGQGTSLQPSSLPAPAANLTQQWYPEVLHFCPYTPLILVGLKSDLRYKKTCIDMLKTQGLTPVTREQGMGVAQKMNAQYMECSSKEMKGVDEIFEQAIVTVVSNDRRNLEAQAAQRQSSRRDSSHLGGIPGAAGIRKKKRKCNFL